jgi:malonyl-CoA O-methyltransferase
MTAPVSRPIADARVAQHYFPCSGENPNHRPLVLIHGWGNDSRVWSSIIPYLNDARDIYTLDLPGFGDSTGVASLEEAVIAIAEVIPDGACLLGWSLGGMLAVQIAARFPNKIGKLITLASNARFVASAEWPQGMEATVFRRFYEGMADNPEATYKQFCGLQARGDNQERRVLRWLRGNSPAPSETWQQGLDWLSQLDNRTCLRELAVPSLHLLMENDALVPSAVSGELMALLPSSSRVGVLPGLGHAPQVSAPELIAQQVTEFLQAPSTDPYALNKREIASSFGKAAETYDHVADLQRQVGEDLLARIPTALEPAAIADMGCGTGYFTGALARRFDGAQVTGVDLAPGMIRYAADHHNGDITWLCGDAENLPLADQSLDLVFSNFTFQWCFNLEKLFAEQFRILRPGGVLVFSTVGPESLAELRGAWQQVDRFVHVNRFAELSEVRKALETSGFKLHDERQAHIRRYYDRLQALTRELKYLGAHNMNAGRKAGLTSIRQIERLKAAYESYRTPEGLPATWQVYSVVVTRP